MWQKYFKLVKLKPGKVVTALLGEIDFSSNSIPLEKLKQLYENDFPYLEITDEGKRESYGLQHVKDKDSTKYINKRIKKSRVKTINN